MVRRLNFMPAMFSMLLSACGFGIATQHERVQHGPFEIVADGKRISSGGFPNTSSNPFQSTEVTSFSVRHRGQAVVVTHGERVLKTFWTVLRLPDAPRPALLVANTDVHLLSEEGGRLVIQALAPEPSTHTVRLQWLDGPDGQPGPVLDYGIRYTPGDETLLQGGRYLRTRQAVLDVATLAIRPYAWWLDREGNSGSPLTGLNATDRPAIAFSPGRSQFVLLGHDDRDEPGLLVVDIVTGKNHGVTIDRQATGFRDGLEVTNEWLLQHYEWRRNAAGEERLVARERPYASHGEQ